MQPPVGAICDKVSVRARRSRNPSPVARDEPLEIFLAHRTLKFDRCIHDRSFLD